MLIKRWAILGALVIAALASAGFEASAHGLTLEQAVLDCRLITAHKARLVCYDSMKVDPSASAQAMSPEPGAGQAAQAEPGTPAPAPGVVASAAPASTPTPAAAAPTSRALIDGDLAKITLQITSVYLVENKLRIVTSDGFTWAQIEDQQIRAWPKPGGTMTITKALIQGHLCQVSRWDRYHCKPVH